MNGVPAEVAQEIPVLLQHGHLDSGPGQQDAEHHPGRAPANNAARHVFHADDANRSVRGLTDRLGVG
ncbi:hypothetical protein GCM10022380_38250 [Amycolatopsis tucumanensis]|uniref:Uncharacterized protein n=1 Tax=Amycolatopsis tucumanensis TaxID=401106 RepID=A0ABP7IEA7_9PSEU